MPFLFVDYDQGAGGEFFCYSLSLENGCVPLAAESSSQGRYKVYDSYEQEFIQEHPIVTYKKSNNNLYEIIPSHRNTYIAKDIGLDFRSIRIAFPVTKPCIDFVIYQRVNKVLLAPLQTTKHFFGELKALLRESKNKDWIKKTSKDMDYLSLLLLANDIEPTVENREYCLEKLLQDKRDEPNFDYDLVIEYENLIDNTSLVKKQIKEIFGITIHGDWLEKYKKNYNAYHTKT